VVTPGKLIISKVGRDLFLECGGMEKQERRRKILEIRVLLD